MRQSKEEIIKNFIKAYNAFNIDSMLSFLHPEVQFKNILNGEVNIQTIGKDEFKTLAIQSATIFKEREQKIISYNETNDKINIKVQYQAVLAVDLPNGLKNGEVLNIQGKSEYIFKDKLIYSIVDES